MLKALPIYNKKGANTDHAYCFLLALMHVKAHE